MRVRMMSGLGSTALAQQFDRHRRAAVSATRFFGPRVADACTTQRCLPGLVVAVGSRSWAAAQRSVKVLRWPRLLGPPAAMVHTKYRQGILLVQLAWAETADRELA